MSFAFRDFRLAPLENSGSVITFNGQTIPPLPNGETLTYARAGVNAIAGPSSAGNAWLWHEGTNLWERLNDQPVGGWGVVIDDVYVAWQEQNVGTRRRLIDTQHVPELLPIPWQATGLLDMVNGVVRSDDRSQPFSVTWGGVTYLCQLWMTRAGRTVMQANNMPGGSGVVVWDANTSQLWRVYSGDYQVPPRLSADGRTVALTGDMASGFVADSQWTLEPQAQPIPPIVPLTRPTLFGAFLHPNEHGMMPLWANAHIDEGAGGEFLYGDDQQLWKICDLEQTPGAVIPSPACYIGASPSDFAHLRPHSNPYDLYALEVYRAPGMSDADFESYAAASLGLMLMPAVIITNSTTRLGPNGPTLTPRDVQAAQAILSRFGLPVLVFEAGRPGEVPETAAQFDQWRNGQSCPPQVLPPSDSTAAVKLLMEK